MAIKQKEKNEKKPGFWHVEKETILAKNKNQVTLYVRCNCVTDHLFPNAVAYMAGGLAWHVKSSSIPVTWSTDEGVNVVGIDFEL